MFHTSKLYPSRLPALRELPAEAGFQTGDVLVVFGELFARGYANGIVDEATRRGLKVIRSTVGRRTPEGELRALTSEELATQPQPFINVPLEAGFDLESIEVGDTGSARTAVSLFDGVKLSDWMQTKVDIQALERARERGRVRFRDQVQRYMRELKSHIAPGKNVIFCHTMAGGVPRTKVIMPVMNRVFKGQGDRHVSSQALYESDLGRFALMNFDEVTAETFKVLIEESATLRSEIEMSGGRASYLAFGYHGTEILTKGQMRWQTYTPYFQGWAKMKLEDYAAEAHAQGLRACVYNCPEILTNSSSIFIGVEVSLYPLLGALRNSLSSAEGLGRKRIESVLQEATQLVKPELRDNQAYIDKIQEFVDAYVSSEVIQRHSEFAKWPQASQLEQMEKMLSASEELFAINVDEKQPMTSLLSEQVFRATGALMFHDAWNCSRPVVWLGHDAMASALASGRTL